MNDFVQKQKSKNTDFIPKPILNIFDNSRLVIGDRIGYSNLITISKHGKTVSWESGGFNKDINKGYSVIWSDSTGLSLNPLFIIYKHRVNEHVFRDCLLENKQALFEVKKGFFIFISYFNDNKLSTYIFKLRTLLDNNYISFLKLVNVYENYNWKRDIPLRFISPVNASVCKALCNDCHHIHYYKSTLISKIIKNIKQKNSKSNNKISYIKKGVHKT